MPRKVMVVTTSWGANGVTPGLAAEAIKEGNLQTALEQFSAIAEKEIFCAASEMP